MEITKLDYLKGFIQMICLFIGRIVMIIIGLFVVAIAIPFGKRGTSKFGETETYPPPVIPGRCL